MECFSYKSGCGICISRHLKGELALAIDKRLQVFRNMILFIYTKELNNNIV